MHRVLRNILLPTLLVLMAAPSVASAPVGHRADAGAVSDACVPLGDWERGSLSAQAEQASVQVAWIDEISESHGDSAAGGPPSVVMSFPGKSARTAGADASVARKGPPADVPLGRGPPA